MDREFTAVFKKSPEGYIGFVEELPGANTQGATLEEARANLREAVELVLDARRALLDEDLGGGGEVPYPGGGKPRAGTLRRRETSPP